MSMLPVRRVESTPGFKPLRPVKAANPRDTWPDWTDADTWEPCPEPLDTTDFAEAFEPTPKQLASLAGFDRGFNGDLDAEPAADMDPDVALSWWFGRALGVDVRRKSDDARIDELEARAAEPPFEELAQAGGVEYARSYRA
jgi:hypothetical protein